MVVDDTVLYRKVVSDALVEIPGVEVVGTANNGKIAFSRINSLKPDLVTLDVEMPEMDGLDVLTQIKEAGLDVGVIMVSSLTKRGSEITIKALELGAFEFITKPETSSMDESRKAVSSLLTPIVKAFMRNREITNLLKARRTGGGIQAGGGPTRAIAAAAPSVSGISAPPKVQARSLTRIGKSGIIVIGISTGGPNALARMLPSIPGDIGVPILIVQHMPPVFTQSLATSLNAKCAVRVKEASDGDILEAGTALIAPGGKQMKIVSGADAKSVLVKITDDPPENSCKPSVDYLFRSVAFIYREKVTGVIMTGMGYDGTLGLKLMKRYGAVVIAQDEASCVVYGMPKGAVDAGIVDVIAPLDQIATEITRTVR